MTVSDRDWRNYERAKKVLESWHLGDGPPSTDLNSLAASEVAVLRRFGSLAGGVPTEDEPAPEEISTLFRRRLKRLVKLGGEDLLVPESPALGGFGHTVGGRLYNLDTLKHFEALTALRRGGLLNELMRATDQRVVMQMGPNWGGFAYQLKTLCPTLTVVLADVPDNLLLSAVYLMNRFPDARCFFCGPHEAAVDWRRYDFIFTLQTPLPRLNGPPLHLLVSIQGFESLPGSEIAATVDWAYSAGCPFLYSLDTHDAAEPGGTVFSIFERAYWPHEIPVMSVSFDEMFDGVVGGETLAAPQRAQQSGPRYRHLVGWRKWGA
mgnify:CR=1 FL=1